MYQLGETETARQTIWTTVTLSELHAQVIAQLAVRGAFGRTQTIKVSRVNFLLSSQIRTGIKTAL